MMFMAVLMGTIGGFLVACTGINAFIKRVGIKDEKDFSGLSKQDMMFIVGTLCASYAFTGLVSAMLML